MWCCKHRPPLHTSVVVLLSSKLLKAPTQAAEDATASPSWLSWLVFKLQGEHKLTYPLSNEIKDKRMDNQSEDSLHILG